MKLEFMRLRRAITLVLATILATAGITLLSPAGAALAHHNTVNVTAQCVDYEWTIVWTITNSEYDKSEKITVSNQPNLVPVGTEIGKGKTLTVKETVDGPVDKTLTVVGYWASSNVTDRPRSATITKRDFAGTCEEPTQPTPPVTPYLNIASSACVYDGTASTADVTASATGLPRGATYTIRLFSGATVVGTAEGTAASGAATATFPGLAPGEYRAEIIASGSNSVVSSSVTISDCAPENPPVEPAPDPLPPVSPPRLVITPLDCLSDASTPTVSVSVTGLDSTKVYQVVLLDDQEAPVASQSVTGVTSDEVVFENLDAPASYAAILSLEEGYVVEASTEFADVVPCVAGGGTLPVVEPAASVPADTTPAATPTGTLAVTGAGELAALAAFAALLLTAGGIIVMTRLRRRATA